MAADSREVSSEELRLAISESLRQLDALGIPAEVSCNTDRQIPAERVTEVYALCESLLERALPTLKAVTAVINEKELKITLEGAEVSLPEMENAETLFEDGASYIRLPLTGKGETV